MKLVILLLILVSSCYTLNNDKITDLYKIKLTPNLGRSFLSSVDSVAKENCHTKCTENKGCTFYYQESKVFFDKIFFECTLGSGAVSSSKNTIAALGYSTIMGDQSVKIKQTIITNT